MPGIPQIAAMMQGIVTTAVQQTAGPARTAAPDARCVARANARPWLAHPAGRMEHLASVAADRGATITPHGACERAPAPAVTWLEQD